MLALGTQRTFPFRVPGAAQADSLCPSALRTRNVENLADLGTLVHYRYGAFIDLSGFALQSSASGRMDGTVALSPAAGLVMALAGAVGGGPWAYWAYHASQVVSHPHVQAAVHQVGIVGADAAKTAYRWSEDADLGGDSICMGKWSAILAANGGFILCVVFMLLSCLCCATSGGLGWWGSRYHANTHKPRTPSQLQLEVVANFISSGGDSAIAQVAADLNVTEEAVRTWWVHWQLAHCGPRRA